MKKTILLLLALCITSMMFADNFVMIKIKDQQNLRELFNKQDLNIHYYNDNFVLATSEDLNENMTLLDENSFVNNDLYFIVYCEKGEQQNYISFRRSKRRRCAGREICYRKRIFHKKTSGKLGKIRKRRRSNTKRNNGNRMRSRHLFLGRKKPRNTIHDKPCQKARKNCESKTDIKSAPPRRRHRPCSRPLSMALNK